MPVRYCSCEKKNLNNQSRSFKSSNFDLDLRSSVPCGQSRVTTVDRTPAPRPPSPTLSPWLPRRPTLRILRPRRLSSRLSGPRRLAPRTVHTGPPSSSLQNPPNARLPNSNFQTPTFRRPDCCCGDRRLGVLQWHRDLDVHGVI